MIRTVPGGTASTDASLPALLRERADLQPDDTAYTFVDFEVDTAGFVESLSWRQVHDRAQIVADELARTGKPGDRAAILAPEGLDYIVAFLGALQAGFIAVPLPVPQFRAHDERVSAALRDCAPSAVLTTTVAVAETAKYVSAGNGCAGATVVEVDSLDLYTPVDVAADPPARPGTAYLQYTSGSTRSPAGVMVSHRNVIANIAQAGGVYFEDYDNRPPPGMKLVSWLPFHHDMGLFFSVFTPLYSGTAIRFMSPTAFLQRPARWLQMLGEAGMSYSCAPNFAFDLAARRTSDFDMEGVDLSGVMAIINGAERVQPTSIRQFNERFAPFGLKDTAIQPSYGLAEATLCVAAPRMGRPVRSLKFSYEQLSEGRLTECDTADSGGAELVSYGPPRLDPHMCAVRIVDPETGKECPSGKTGEIWAHGENVAAGYWRNSEQSEQTFGGRIVDPSPATPEGTWLRTGDLGAMHDGELFVVGRIKDVLIVDGRNHYPDDIEATIRELVAGRVAAITVPDDRTERLVLIVELSERADSADELSQKLRAIKRDIISAVSTSHSLRVADLVAVPPGSIPFTTSGKVRRSACVDRYRGNEFKRLDATAAVLDEAW